MGAGLMTISIIIDEYQECVLRLERYQQDHSCHTGRQKSTLGRCFVKGARGGLYF